LILFIVPHSLKQLTIIAATHGLLPVTIYSIDNSNGRRTHLNQRLVRTLMHKLVYNSVTI
jgi:hypothetical protein